MFLLGLEPYLEDFRNIGISLKYFEANLAKDRNENRKPEKEKRKKKRK
jgi:hypothetical protein